jgi:hypothetical protein
VARDFASSRRKVQLRRKVLLELNVVLWQQANAKPVPQPNGAQQPKESDETKSGFGGSFDDREDFTVIRWLDFVMCISSDIRD